MWFKKKQTNQSNGEPSNARRKGDMRSELGLSGETHHAVRVRAAGVQPQLRTVTVDGASKTRVRLGLFKTQTEAEAALAKVKGVAKNPVVIPIQQEQTKPKP